LAGAVGVTACLAFVAHRIFRFNRYTGDLPPFLKQFPASIDLRFTLVDWHWLMWLSVWIIETGILTGYMVAFTSRTGAKSVARGFMEVVFPMIIAGLPFLIVLTPMNFNRVWPPAIGALKDFLYNQTVSANFKAAFLLQSWEPVFFLFLTVIIVGGAINLLGLLSLRKAFTITAEARLLIRQGLFKYIRHPLYAGHFVMFAGYLLFHLYWYTVMLYLIFLGGQYLRARMEERKLMSVFSEYADYRRDTGMFVPKIGRKTSQLRE